MRLLITGSRDWDDLDTFYNALYDVLKETERSEAVIVHGACPTGADMLADTLAFLWNVTVEPYPADWDTRGKKAGPFRNHLMVTLGADHCLAFIKNNSKGASHCATLAQLAGIPTTIFRN